MKVLKTVLVALTLSLLVRVEGAAALPAGVALNDSGAAFIADIYRFLESCPSSDPATAVILSDFQIRHNGVLVQNFPCTAPVSKMSVSQYSDELIILQGLRVLYYMDQGFSGHLPWTAKSVYGWMKEKIGGFNLKDGTGSSYCCESYGGRPVVVIKPQDDYNREFDKRWRGISGNLSLYAHETRHVDGYMHISCPGSSADDQNFDVNNLTTRGVQWWLAKLFLSGDINVGAGCGSAQDISEMWQWHWGEGHGAVLSFCGTKPEDLVKPAYPGGRCVPVIGKAVVSGSVLKLTGLHFGKKSKIYVNGKRRPTQLRGASLRTESIGVKLKKGVLLRIRVRNADGANSPLFLFKK